MATFGALRGAFEKVNGDGPITAGNLVENPGKRYLGEPVAMLAGFDEALGIAHDRSVNEKDV